MCHARRAFDNLRTSAAEINHKWNVFFNWNDSASDNPSKNVQLATINAMKAAIYRNIVDNVWRRR